MHKLQRITLAMVAAVNHMKLEDGKGVQLDENIGMTTAVKQ
jgi:hypothetical protein